MSHHHTTNNNNISSLLHHHQQQQASSSSNRDSIRVVVRVRPPDAETQQYNGGLTMQERKAAFAKNYHDDPHDVITLSSGPSLHGRRRASSIASSSAVGMVQDRVPHQGERYNLCVVQQTKAAITNQTVSLANAYANQQQQQQSSTDLEQQQQQTSMLPKQRSKSASTLIKSARTVGASASFIADQRDQRQALHRTTSSSTKKLEPLRRTKSASSTSLLPPNRRNNGNNNNINGNSNHHQSTQHQQEPSVRFSRYCFEFDACFSSNPAHPAFADQSQIFQVVGRPAVEHVLKGFNFTTLCCGQTGGGKTYTMFFSGASRIENNLPKSAVKTAANKSSADERGLVYRVAEALCQRVHQAQHRAASASNANNNHQNHHEPDPRRPPVSRDVSVASTSLAHHPASSNVTTMTCSYFEIYCDKVWCLLNPTEALRVREHKTQGPFVEGLTEVPISHVDDVYKIVEKGTVNRHFAATLHNHNSSRSHALLLINVHQRQRAQHSGSVVYDEKSGSNVSASVFLSSKLYMVDLAGSERVSPHDEVVDVMHRSEAKHINSSLTVLGKVITALAQLSGSSFNNNNRNTKGKQKNSSSSAAFIPYRDSVLTRVLKDSFGGNSKTVMIATVSPELKDLDETISTLRYASRARYIQNRPVVNSAMSAEDRDRDAIIETLAKRVEELELMLAESTSTGGGMLMMQNHRGKSRSHSSSSFAGAGLSSIPRPLGTTTNNIMNNINNIVPHLLLPTSSVATVQVGAVRWNVQNNNNNSTRTTNAMNSNLQQQQQQQNGNEKKSVSVSNCVSYCSPPQHWYGANTPGTVQSTNAPGTSSSNSARSTMTTMTDSASININNNNNNQNAMFQTLLERTSQHQAMLERIEEREKLLLKILSSSSSSSSGPASHHFDPFASPLQDTDAENTHHLMRGPAQTPGNQLMKTKLKPSSSAQHQNRVAHAKYRSESEEELSHSPEVLRHHLLETKRLLHQQLVQPLKMGDGGENNDDNDDDDMKEQMQPLEPFSRTTNSMMNNNSALNSARSNKSDSRDKSHLKTKFATTNNDGSETESTSHHCHHHQHSNKSIPLGVLPHHPPPPLLLQANRKRRDERESFTASNFANVVQHQQQQTKAALSPKKQNVPLSTSSSSRTTATAGKEGFTSENQRYATPTKYSSSTAALAQENDEAEENVRSPSVTPPPNATPLLPKMMASTTASTHNTGLSKPLFQQFEAAPRLNKVTMMTTTRVSMTGDENSNFANSQQQQTQLKSQTAMQIQERRAQLAARAEALKKKKSEIQQQWNDVVV